MWLSGRIAASAISSLHDVARQTVSGMDAQNVLIDAISVAVGWGAVPGDRAKAIGVGTHFLDANLIGNYSTVTVFCNRRG